MRQIFVTWDGDSIGNKIGHARLNNDVEGCQKINEEINNGNKLFTDFAVNNLGTVGEAAGDEGFIIIPADKLPEIPPLSAQYHQITGCTVTIGIGMDLASSSKALLIGKIHGKDNLTTWLPEMQEIIDDLMSHPISEKDKEVQAYLGHEDSDYLNKADPADIQRRLQPTVPHGNPHVSLPEVKLDTPQESPPPSPEDEFHGHAQKQGAQDLHDKAHSKDNFQKIKQNVVGTLQAVRQQLPAIAQLKETSPDAYNSIVGLLQGVIDLGKETEIMSTVKKSEKLSKAISTLSPGKGLEAKIAPHPSAKGASVFTRTFDYSHLLPDHAKQTGFKLHVEHKNTMLPKGVQSIPTSMTSPNVRPVGPSEIIRSVLKSPDNREVGYVYGHVSPSSKHGKVIQPHSDLNSSYKGKGFGTAMYEATYAHAKSNGVNRVEGGVHSPDAHALHTRLAKKHGFHYKGSQYEDPDDYFPYKPYSYALKSEVFHESEDGFLGPGHGPIFYRDGIIEKDEIETGGANEGTPRRTGANAGGAQAGRRHMNLPVGTALDGKVKIINGITGLANWRSVKGGAIQSQQHNPPILGANSSPTSASNPDR